MHPDQLGAPIDALLTTSIPRRPKLHGLRAAMKALEAGPELEDPADDLESLIQSSQSQAEQDSELERHSEFDQKLTAENPFVRRTERLGHTTFSHEVAAEGMQVSPDLLQEPTDHRAPSVPPTPPDFNIQ